MNQKSLFPQIWCIRIICTDHQSKNIKMSTLMLLGQWSKFYEPHFLYLTNIELYVQFYSTTFHLCKSAHCPLIDSYGKEIIVKYRQNNMSHFNNIQLNTLLQNIRSKAKRLLWDRNPNTCNLIPESPWL